MKLRTAEKMELGAIYERLLRPAFPPAELKPLRAIVDMVDDGCYDPLVLEDGGAVIGTAFLLLGVPGWALLDYLCVDPARRNDGLGAVLIRQMLDAYPGWVILAEAESPEFAPDPAIAERRLGFYARNSAKLAEYDTEAFGVRYKTLYWAEDAVDEADLIVQHQFIYQSRFGQEKYEKYLRIPCPAGVSPRPAVPWTE